MHPPSQQCTEIYNYLSTGVFGDDIADTLAEFKAKAHTAFPYALLFKEPAAAPSEPSASALIAAAKEEATLTTMTATPITTTTTTTDDDDDNNTTTQA